MIKFLTEQLNTIEENLTHEIKKERTILDLEKE